MAKVMTSQQFIDKLKWLVNSVPNEYYSGSQWLTYDKATGKFRMDCVLSVKGILWGFSANKNKTRGGAVYCSNGVKDFSCNGALNYCTDVSKDFNNLVAGEYLCMKNTKYNHTGIYLGNGKVFECTSCSAWGVKKCVISDISKDGTRSYKGIKCLKWTYHGKLNYIDYETPPKPQPVNQVKLWQETMNKQFNCGLAVDGKFGPISTSEAKKHQLMYNCKYPIMIKWLQHRLNELGYKLAEDGKFGPATLKAVKDFQTKKKLKVDGYVGPNTYKALVK